VAGQAAPSLKTAVRTSFEQNYELSGRELAELIRSRPLDPEPLYWQAVLVQMLAYDEGSFAMLDSFYRLSNRVEALCQSRISRNSSDARAYLYLGMNRLARTNSQSWEQKKGQAARTALTVASPLRTALKLDSTLTGAYLGLGMTEYFGAMGNRYLLGLKLLGSKPRAYEFVRTAAQDTGLFRTSARFSLAWMYGDDHRYREAVELGQELLREFPGNRSMMRTLRDVHLREGHYQEAIKLGREIENNLRQSRPDNRYYWAENWLKMAQSWDGLGQADSAVARAGQVLALKGYESCTPWLGTYLREAGEIRDKYRK